MICCFSPPALIFCFYSGLFGILTMLCYRDDSLVMDIWDSMPPYLYVNFFSISENCSAIIFVSWFYMPFLLSSDFLLIPVNLRLVILVSSISYWIHFLRSIVFKVSLSIWSPALVGIRQINHWVKTIWRRQWKSYLLYYNIMT